jgi:aryl-alcohol dehydrogenase-like predicted oxidoreductase
MSFGCQTIIFNSDLPSNFASLITHRNFEPRNKLNVPMAPLTRTLGRNGPQVTAIGLGCMSLGGAYAAEAQSNEEKLELLSKAWEIGARFWDTADIYFDSEDRIGDWFKANPDKRSDIFLATKFAAIFDRETGSMGVRSDPEYVPIACAKSLEKLGVETIDLYYW